MASMDAAIHETASSNSMKRATGWRLGAALFLAAGVTTFAWLLSSSPSSLDMRSGSSRKLQRESFGVLRSLPSGLPPRVLRVLRNHASGADWMRANLIVPGVDRQVWLVPGGRRLCLVSEHLSSVDLTCARTEIALRRGVSATTLTNRQQAAKISRGIVGVAPDWADAVRIHTPGFPTVTRPVERNVFVLTDHIPQPPETIELLEGRSAATAAP